MSGYRGGGEDGYPGLGIAVVDAFHNKGIGQRLIRQIEDIARERGEQGLALTCYRGELSGDSRLCQTGLSPRRDGLGTMSSFGWFATLLTMIRHIQYGVCTLQAFRGISRR